MSVLSTLRPRPPPRMSPSRSYSLFPALFLVPQAPEFNGRFSARMPAPAWLCQRKLVDIRRRTPVPWCLPVPPIRVALHRICFPRSTAHSNAPAQLPPRTPSSLAPAPSRLRLQQMSTPFPALCRLSCTLLHRRPAVLHSVRLLLSSHRAPLLPGSRSRLRLDFCVHLSRNAPRLPVAIYSLWPPEAQYISPSLTATRLW